MMLCRLRYMNNAKDLLEKYKTGQCTSEELALLGKWFHQLNESESSHLTEEELLEARATLQGNMKELIGHGNPRPLWPHLAAAAAVLMVLSFGAYFLLHKQEHPKLTVQSVTPDIAPGSNKATITLANGQQIAISHTKNGLLASQGTTNINIKNGSEVVYNSKHSTKTTEEPEYNTMTTPRGGQHALILADGTKVWLDAASSITFPVAFTRNERLVKIIGQAYFEVAHDAGKPFKVTANGQTVEVLGTHFNINAYADEAVTKTTLFEGRIKISAKRNQTILQPGQQAMFTQNQIKVIKDADIEEAIAWHKGKFLFHSADMQTVLRQLSRWYDVDFEYETPLTDSHFSGGIYRNNALKISDILRFEKINFRMEGKKITIIP